MKKSICALLVLAVGTFSVFADAFPTAVQGFTDAIQDLAIQIACIMKYSMTQAKNGGWYKDPHNYYTETMMAERFAKMSGDKTETPTFYGICFNYAQHAWDDIAQRKNWYNAQGMYENKFWMVGVDENPNEIILEYPGTKTDYTTIQNGVHVKSPKNGKRQIKTHRLMNKGDRAIIHEWIWIERADGVQFWVDPTWTDNLGYVVYGYVSDNGEEIQCRPDRKFCVLYPDELNDLPSPPPMGARKAPSPSANSTDRNEIIKDTGTDWFDTVMRKTFLDVVYDFDSNYIALLASANIPFSAAMDKSPDVNQMAFSLEIPMLFDEAAGIIGLEYLQNLEDDYHVRGGLFTFDFTRRLTSFMAWYVGFGMGLRFDALNNDNYYAPENISYLASTGYFAFKANTGLLLNISRLFTKIDVSYDNVLGFSVGAGIGFGWKVY